MFKRIKLFGEDLLNRNNRHFAKIPRLETLVIEETVTYHPRVQIKIDKGTNLEAIERALGEAQEEATEGFASFIDTLRDKLPEGARVHLHDLPDAYRYVGAVKTTLRVVKVE